MFTRLLDMSLHVDERTMKQVSRLIRELMRQGCSKEVVSESLGKVQRRLLRKLPSFEAVRNESERKREMGILRYDAGSTYLNYSEGLYEGLAEVTVGMN